MCVCGKLGDVERADDEADTPQHAAAGHQAILAACPRDDGVAAAADLMHHFEESGVALVPSEERLDEIQGVAL
jgi:DNA-binding GntR family transcriptional regulator